MSVDQMRYSISMAYSGKKWANKVKRMSDSQVIAVYHRFVAQGKL